MVSTVVFTEPSPAPIVAISVVGLIVLLIARELCSAAESLTLQRIGHQLGAFTTPFLLVFFFIVFVAIFDVLS